MIKLLDSINPRFKGVLDTRQSVDSLNTIDMPYEGLISYQKSDKTLNLYKDGSFIDLFKNINDELTKFDNRFDNLNFINVKEYNVKGDGISDDTDNINSVISSNNNCVIYFPYGTYLINQNGIVGKSNIKLMFETGATIKLSANLIKEGIIFNNCNNFEIDGATIDQNGFTGTLIGSLSSSYWTIKNCHLVNVKTFGFGLNNVSYFKILNNTIDFTQASNTQNQAINLSEYSGVCTHGRISGNECNKSAINISGSYLTLDNNIIHDFMFGSGITTEQLPTNHTNILSNNIIYNGIGTDVNTTNCAGIENWGSNYVIVNNIIYNNSGSGIDQGGKNAIVANNQIYNNGTIGGDGIKNRYGSADYNGSYSIIVGNAIYNSGGLQGYGINDESASITRVTIGKNYIRGNKIAPMNILGSFMDIETPKLFASASINFPSINIGTSALSDITCAGAKVGDIVNVSASIDLQGLTMTAYVNVDNNIKVCLANLTGAVVDLASATFTAVVIKKPNYVDL